MLNAMYLPTWSSLLSKTLYWIACILFVLVFDVFQGFVDPIGLFIMYCSLLQMCRVHVRAFHTKATTINFARQSGLVASFWALNKKHFVQELLYDALSCH